MATKQTNPTNGYGKKPKRVFQLAPHQQLLDVNPFGKFGKAHAAYLENRAFQLLRDPKGRPVTRLHTDLRPGEVSLVLE